MISKLLTAKFAGLAAAATLGVGTAAAAVSGVLPGQNPPPKQSIHVAAPNPSSSASAARIFFKTGATGPKQERPHGSGRQTGVSGGTNALPATGMDNSKSAFGLCTAFLTHHPTTTSTAPGSSDEAPPFHALIQDNGGVTQTVAYCHNLVAAHSSTTAGPRSSDRPDTAPPSAGNPSGANKSSTAGQSSTAGRSPEAGRSSGSGSQTGAQAGGTDHSGSRSPGSGSGEPASTSGH